MGYIFHAPTCTARSHARILRLIPHPLLGWSPPLERHRTHSWCIHRAPAILMQHVRTQLKRLLIRALKRRWHVLNDTHSHSSMQSTTAHLCERMHTCWAIFSVAEAMVGDVATNSNIKAMWGHHGPPLHLRLQWGWSMVGGLPAPMKMTCANGVHCMRTRRTRPTSSLSMILKGRNVKHGPGLGSFGCAISPWSISFQGHTQGNEPELQGRPCSSKVWMLSVDKDGLLRYDSLAIQATDSNWMQNELVVKT